VVVPVFQSHEGKSSNFEGHVQDLRSWCVYHDFNHSVPVSPRLYTPRDADRALQRLIAGIFEGIANIEAGAYSLLHRNV